jgi:hypothetical protein
MEFGYLFSGFAVLMLIAWYGGAELAYWIDTLVCSIWPDKKRLPPHWLCLLLAGTVFWVTWLPFLACLGLIFLICECQSVKRHLDLTDQAGHSADSQGC